MDDGGRPEAVDVAAGVLSGGFAAGVTAWPDPSREVEAIKISS